MIKDEKTYGNADDVFDQNEPYTKMTEVQVVDCPLKAFKAFLCCKAILPRLVREAAKNDPQFQSGKIIDAMDTFDEYTNCYEPVEGMVDCCIITALWHGPRPGSFWML